MSTILLIVLIILLLTALPTIPYSIHGTQRRSAATRSQGQSAPATHNGHATSFGNDSFLGTQVMTNNERSTGNPRRSMRLHLAWGVTTTAILILGVGGWAATTELAGAVIAPGFLVVDSNVKKVQHPTGGVVGELRVRDGDPVKRGDIVVRLDETQTKANLAIITKSLDELGARQARLEAERDGTENVLFSADLLGANERPKGG